MNKSHWDKVATLFKPIKESSAIFLFYLLMSYVILFLSDWDPWPRLVYPVLDGFLLCLIAFVLKKTYLDRLLLWPIVVLIVGGELFCELFYDSFYSIRIVQLVAETNSKESSEFLSSVLTRPEMISTLGWVIGIGLASIGIGRGIKKTQKTKYASILGLMILGLVTYSATKQIPYYKKNYQSFRAKETSQLAQLYGKGFMSPMTRLLYGIAYNKVSTSEMSLLAETLRATEVRKCNVQNPLIVLVIGESFSKHHTSLYEEQGVNTNPRLKKLEAEGSLVTYSDIVAPSNITSNVMKKLFSMKREEDSTGWIYHPLFTTLFKKAGYNVVLRTNQFSLQDNEDFNQMGGTIFNIPMLSELQFTDRNDSLYEYDEELINQIPDTAALQANPCLLIVHLMGQHVQYDKRYPSTRTRFTADSVTSAIDSPEARQVTADYANATLYNDSIVSAIWDKVKSLDAVCLYFSDHGEECYDWRNFHERSDESFINANIARYQFEVPYMFLLSDRFKANHPDFAEQIIAAQDRPGMNSDASHVLLYLGGIETEAYDESHNILSPDYNSSKPRYIGNHTDYDAVTKGE